MAAIVFSLGGIDLNPNMIWRDRFTSQQGAQTTLRTLAGSFIIYPQSLSLGESIILESTEEQGWLTKTQVDAVLGLAINAGAIYQLNVGGDIKDVDFRHEEPPAAVFTPLVPRLNVEANDYFTGVIKLTTV